MTNETSDTPGLRIPPPLLMLIFIIVAFGFGLTLPIPIPSPWWVRGLGGLLVLAGVVMGGLAVRTMAKASTSPDPFHPTNAIVVGGPYKITRNPIYLGFVLVIIGLPLIFGFYWGAFLSTIAIDAFNRLVIVKEEAYLERKFGQPYLDFKARVRRWL